MENEEHSIISEEDIFKISDKQERSLLRSFIPAISNVVLVRVFLALQEHTCKINEDGHPVKITQREFAERIKMGEDRFSKLIKKFKEPSPEATTTA